MSKVIARTVLAVWLISQIAPVMAAKVAVVTTTTPTSTGTIDVTDSSAGFASDLKWAMCTASAATANHTATAHAAISVGMAANNSGTTQVGHAVLGEDAQATTDEGTVQSTSKFFERLGTASTPTQVIEADLSSWLSNGIRLNFTTVNAAAEKLTCLLVGGSDVEAKVLHGNFPGTGSNDLVLAHGLSGTPSMLVVLGDASTPTWMPLGFYDGTNTAGVNYTSTNAAAATNVQSILSSSLVIPAYNTIADAYTVQALDATNVTLRDTGNATGGRGATVLAIRGLTAKAGFFTTDTSTGSTNKITSLAVVPQAAIFIGTRMTTVGTSTTDPGGAFNLGFAANRSGSTIQQGSASLSEQDAVSPSVNKNQTSSTEALRILDTAGAADYEGAVNAFNSTSIGINTTNAAASALEVAYIAFGSSVPAGGITLTSIGVGSPCEAFNAATSPDLVAGDILYPPSTTSPGSYALTVGADCQFSYTGDGSRQLALNIPIWDLSAGAYHADDIDFVSNDLPPLAPDPHTVTFFVPLNSAMTPVDLTVYCVDPEDDTITVTGSNLPTGLSISGGTTLQGTATSRGIYTDPDFVCVDQYGSSSEHW